MSISQGTFTVVVATVIASGMIAVTGNSIAEVKGATSAEVLDASIPALKQQPFTAQTQVSDSPMELIAKTTIAPPPGPFSNDEVAAPTPQTALLRAPMAPKAPDGLLKQPEQRANSLFFDSTVPPSPKSIPKPNPGLNTPTAPVASSVVPKLSKSAPKFDPKMAPVFSGDLAPKQVQMPKLESGSAPMAPKTVDQPIWSQGGNIATQPPVVKSNDKKNSVTPMPNTSWRNNFPAQQYIYVPVPMMPSSRVPPQMPMFNRNVTPPSNYWGAHIQPEKIPNITMKREPTKKHMNVPVKKGNNE